MDTEAIRDALHRQPFEPFTVRLADGRSLGVPHPDFVAVGSRKIVIIGQDDRWCIVEPMMIVSLDQDVNGRPERSD